MFENNRWDGTIVFRIISAVFFAQKKSEKSEATQTVNSSAKILFEVSDQALYVGAVCPHVVNRSVSFAQVKVMNQSAC